MDTYRKVYVVNGQQVDVEDVPPEGNVECLHFDDDEELVYGEDVRNGELYAVTCVGHVDTVKEAAAQCIQKAIENGAPLDLANGVQVFVFLDPASFELGFEIEADDATVAKAKFIVRRNFESKLEAEQDTDEPYVADVLSQEPILRTVKRAIYNSAKQLVGFEYPLFGPDRTTGAPTEYYAFVEFTTLGEQEFIQRLEKDDKESLEKGALYLLPAFNEERLLPVVPYLNYEHMMLADLNHQPIEESDIANHEKFYLFGLSEDSMPKRVDHLCKNALTESDLYDVPLELHWHIFHAYLKQLHEHMMMISREGCNYLRIYTPPTSEPLEGIEMNTGDYRVHMNVFHLNGNFIAHECTVFDSDHTPREQYLMTSPTSFDVYHKVSSERSDEA